jgi:hypothetical protein
MERADDPYIPSDSTEEDLELFDAMKQAGDHLLYIPAFRDSFRASIVDLMLHRHLEALETGSTPPEL